MPAGRLAYWVSPKLTKRHLKTSFSYLYFQSAFNDLQSDLVFVFLTLNWKLPAERFDRSLKAKSKLKFMTKIFTGAVKFVKS